MKKKKKSRKRKFPPAVPYDPGKELKKMGFTDDDLSKMLKMTEKQLYKFVDDRIADIGRRVRKKHHRLMKRLAEEK